MKLNAEVKNDLKNLDLEYGGGVTATAGTRIDMLDKPVLVVGLGGTGAEALIRTKKAVNGYFNLHKRGDGRYDDKPLNIEYLVLDSDDNVENLKYRGIEFNKEHKEFVLLESTNLTSIYKNRDAVFRDLTKDWISDELRLQQVKHGAGGVRQAGRFLMFVNLNNVINAISSKINKLTVNRGANDLLYVFILAGVSGGTGSGIFIDIPYIIRKVAETKGFETENIGMIFLPDVTLSDNAIDGSAALNIKANGFAGLKELDYLMNLEKNGDVFEQKYAGFDVKTDQSPYDICHLISAKDETGKLMPYAKNYCMNVASEAIINFIASEEVLDGQNYTISSYLSNVENNKASFLMTHGQKMPTNYVYNIIGAASAVLPMDYLANHLASRMFDGFDTIFDRSPTTEEVLHTMQSMKIDLYSIEQEIELDKPKPRNMEMYDYNILMQRPNIVEEALSTELMRYREYLEIRRVQIVDAMKERLTLLTQQFTDLERGPFYVRKELSATYEQSILRQISNAIKREIQEKKITSEQISMLELRKESCKEKLFKRGAGFGFMKNNAADNLIDASVQLHKAVMRNETYSAIEGIYRSIYDLLDDYYDEIDSNCELLLALNELLGKFKEPGKKTELSAREAGSFTWDMVGASDFCQSITDGKYGIQLLDSWNNEESLRELLGEVIAQPAGWLQESDISVADMISRILVVQVQSALDKSMDFYMEKLASYYGKAFEQYVGEKLDELRENARVMFPQNHIPSGLHIEFPPYAYVSIPSNAPEIRQKVRKIAGAGNMANVRISKMQGRLYMLNLKIAVPLYCYKELNDYETVYEASWGKLAGMHLFETDEKNWKYLPSPNYDKLWVAGYENPREREYNEHIRRIFEKAVEHGFIKWDGSGQRYLCRYGETPEYATELDTAEAESLNPSQARALLIRLRHFLADEKRLIYEKAIFCGSDKEQEYAKGIFIYMPVLHKRIEAEVIIREKILAVCKKLSVIESSEVKYSDFAQLCYMGKIYKSRKSYKCHIGDEERIIYTLNNMQEAYVEYQIFRAFLEMGEADAGYLKKSADDEESRFTDEQYQEIIQEIDAILNQYNHKLEQLERTFTQEWDGQQKKDFYRTMVDVLEREKEALRN